MPLVALISHQVESLKSAGYSAIQISGETDIDQLKSTSYTHIFITPEMLNTHLEQIIDDTTVNHVFVDESHCVSNWWVFIQTFTLKIWFIHSNKWNEALVACCPSWPMMKSIFFISAGLQPALFWETCWIQRKFFTISLYLDLGDPIYMCTFSELGETVHARLSQNAKAASCGCPFM